MAVSSKSHPLPTESTSKPPPNESSRDIGLPQVFAALARLMGLDEQNAHLLQRIMQNPLIQCFATCLVVFKAFTVSLSSSFIISLVFTVLKFAYEFDALRSLSSAQSKDFDHVSTASPPHGTKHTQPQNHTKKNEKEVIPIEDSDDEKEVDASSSGQTSRDLDNRGSDNEGCDESLHTAEDVLDHSDTNGGSDAQTPPNTCITDEDHSDLSGTTVGGPEPRFGILHPKFADECPLLKRKSDAPATLPQPNLPHHYQPLGHEYKFEDSFGWIIKTPKKRSDTAIQKKMIEPLSEYDKDGGVVYILKHNCYENLYKVGCAKSTEARSNGFRPCEKDMAKVAQKTRMLWGFRRVEALAHLDMAGRNMRMKACLPCFEKRLERMNDGRRNRRKSGEGEKDEDEDGDLIKFHKEWFIGDFEDIKRCVEYWVEVVKASYVRGKFEGHSVEISSHGLSAPRRRLESAEESAQLREENNSTPSRRPRSAGAAGQLDADSPASRENVEGTEAEGGYGEEEAEGSPEMVEVRPGREGLLWERRDPRDDCPLGSSPLKRALRPQPRIFYGPARTGSSR